MDEACRVCVGKRIGNLNRELERAARVQRTSGEETTQRLTLDELEDEIRMTVLLADFIERGDVRMAEGGSQRCFVEKPLPLSGIVDFVRGEHFDGGRPPETGVPCPEHLGAAAGADPLENTVVSERFLHRSDDYKLRLSCVRRPRPRRSR